MQIGIDIDSQKIQLGSRVIQLPRVTLLLQHFRNDMMVKSVKPVQDLIGRLCIKLHSMNCNGCYIKKAHHRPHNKRDMLAQYLGHRLNYEPCDSLKGLDLHKNYTTRFGF